MLVYQDKRYRYDRFGRLCEMRIGSNWVQYFEYDAEQRLVCVEQYRSGERERVVFAYDPLGRRISKEVYQKDYPEPHRRVLFHGQGLRLLQEVQSGLASLYVYATPDSYEPLARIDGRAGGEAIHYLHTNLAGLPEQLTDSSGNTIWQADYHGWGRKHDEWNCKQHAREQNLRYQGQYIDEETGLHYNVSRYYDPDIGRFTQKDTIGISRGINLTTYGPNSLTYADPLGLAVEQIPYGHGLSQSVINQRIIEENFNAAKTNYAAIKYTLNGKEHIEVMRNTPGGLHSEEKLLAKYANRSELNINEIYSERRPCPGCNSLVNRHSPKNIFSFQYSASGRSALQSALSNIKTTIC